MPVYSISRFSQGVFDFTIQIQIWKGGLDGAVLTPVHC